MEFLQSIQDNPVYTDFIQDLTTYFTEKLWHELTLTLARLLPTPKMHENQAILKLYNNFVVHFEKNINPLNLAIIIAAAAHQHTDFGEALQFIQKAIKSVFDDKKSEDAYIYIKLVEAHLSLLVGSKKMVIEDNPIPTKPLNTLPKIAVKGTQDAVIENLFKTTRVEQSSMWDFKPYLREGETFEIPGGAVVFETSNADLQVELPKEFDMTKYTSKTRSNPAENWTIPPNKWFSSIMTSKNPEPERIATRELTKLQPLFGDWEVPIKDLASTPLGDIIFETDNSNRYAAALAILQECETIFKSRIKITPVVSAKYHQVWAEYHKFLEHPAEFFKSTILRLEHDLLSSLTQNQKLELAVELCRSALMGHNVFDVGGLLRSSLIQVLQGSKFQCLTGLIVAFSQGNIQEFEQIVNNNRTIMGQILTKSSEVMYCRQKLAILAFVELCFQIEASERSLTFETVAKHCRIPIGSVESLVIQSIESGLVRARIDQIAQRLDVEWIVPRYLQKPQLQRLKSKLEAWDSRLEKILAVFESQVSGLNTSGVHNISK